MRSVKSSLQQREEQWWVERKNSWVIDERSRPKVERRLWKMGQLGWAAAYAERGWWRLRLGALQCGWDERAMRPSSAKGAACILCGARGEGVRDHVQRRCQKLEAPRAEYLEKWGGVAGDIEDDLGLQRLRQEGGMTNKVDRWQAMLKFAGEVERVVQQEVDLRLMRKSKSKVEEGPKRDD